MTTNTNTTFETFDLQAAEAEAHRLRAETMREFLRSARAWVRAHLAAPHSGKTA
ncbi:RSP_7527 family protein [Celeribacter indicus]|uniref:RSP_7527 family protein n=1 Tax=Celeribacter indicus TaxID=1208324 RepID=UPI000895DB64|nr:hypothetical protein [Celeribacter indicus]SDW13253.1 hypothetical protein SAMN05443573_101498 [Celeribacter indicus]